MLKEWQDERLPSLAKHKSESKQFCNLCSVMENETRDHTTCGKMVWKVHSKPKLPVVRKIKNCVGELETLVLHFSQYLPLGRLSGAPQAASWFPEEIKPFPHVQAHVKSGLGLPNYHP